MLTVDRLVLIYVLGVTFQSLSQVLGEGPKFLKGSVFIFPLLASLLMGIYPHTKFSSRNRHCLLGESHANFQHPSIHIDHRKLSEDTDSVIQQDFIKGS